MLKIGDDVRIMNVFPTMRTIGSSSGIECTVFSGAFKADAYREYAVLVNAEHISTVGPRAEVAIELLCGTTTYASPTAYTSVGGMAVLASGATQTMVNYARVQVGGTGTKIAATLVVDGSTFTLGFGGADSSIRVECTACSLVAAKLATCIANVCTNLDATYYSAGVTTGPAYVDIRPKDGNYTFNITSTSIQNAASVDAIGILVSRSAMYEFKTEDIQSLSTLPYTRFAFRVVSTSTVSKISANLIEGGARYRPNINIARGQLATISTLHST